LPLFQPRDDLISALVRHETTTNLLANGLLAFMRQRDQCIAPREP
jgi:hypothetical protein